MKIKPLPTLVLLVGMTALFAFVGQKPITVESIRTNFLMSIFNDSQPADTTITFTTDYWGYEMKVYPTNLCGWDASFITGSMISAIDTGWVGFDASVRARTLKLFGADIIKGKLKTAAKDYEDKPIEIDQYSAVGVQAAFNKLYQKPTGTFKGYTLQRIYNASAKQYVRDATNIVMAIMAKKTVWDAEVKRYLQQVTTNPEFYMDEFVSQTYGKVFGETEIPECSPSTNRMIGTMLRRAGDGSLPALLLSLKTMLKDYDPEYYNKVALKF